MQGERRRISGYVAPFRRFAEKQLPVCPGRVPGPGQARPPIQAADPGHAADHDDQRQAEVNPSHGAGRYRSAEGHREATL
jgi:hypothetical protein